MRETVFAPDQESEFGGLRTDQIEIHVTCLAGPPNTIPVRGSFTRPSTWKFSFHNYH